MSDSSLRIMITPDEMAAYLVWSPQGQQTLDLAEVENLLALQGVQPMDRESFLAKVKTFKDQPQTLLIAEGKPPAHGQHARVTYYFETDKPCPRPQELPNGRADYYNLNMIQIVGAGTLLAQKVPPTQGIPGYTVTGKTIPATDGRDITLKGQNIIVSEDGLTLKASITGQVIFQNNKVVVLPYYEVNGDVDFSTGNIDFPGSVHIRGSVRGFQVKASGNVEIGGNVDLSSKITAGGDVNVRGGILSEVTAGGKVTARFAEHATINAVDSVFITEAIMYGEINSGKTIEVGGKGLLVGGHYCAGEDIIAKVIGSHLATPTRIKAGVSFQVQREYLETVNALRDKSVEAEGLNKNIHVLRDLLMKGVSLTPDRKFKLTSFLNQLKSLQDEIPQLETKKESLEEIMAAGVKGKIEAREIIYTGVEVFIGNCFTRTLDEYRRATIVTEGGEIKIR